MSLERPSHIAIVGSPGSGRDVLMRLLGRQVTDFEGRLSIGEWDYATLSNDVTSKCIAYATPEPILFPGSLRDNVTFSLKRCQPSRCRGQYRRRARLDVLEAKRSGNPAITQQRRLVRLFRSRSRRC